MMINLAREREKRDLERERERERESEGRALGIREALRSRAKRKPFLPLSFTALFSQLRFMGGGNVHSELALLPREQG